MLSSGVSRMRGLTLLQHVTSESLKHQSIDGDYQFLSQRVEEDVIQGPRLKYIDIVTDTLHASSSDLITWNTLVMMKLRWISEIPREWIDITTNSLETWSARDELSPFHADNRRGYARVTPVALSSVGIPGSSVNSLDKYPTHGLGIYDDYWERFGPLQGCFKGFFQKFGLLV